MLKKVTGRVPAVRQDRPLVLYVEDEDANFRVAQLRLAADYELLHASTDRAACDLLRERGTELRAVLMDIQLKGSTLNGIELTRLIRGQSFSAPLPPYAVGVPTLAMPVFFVTACGADHSSAALTDAGAQGVVPKPVDFVQLSIALARHALANIR